MTPLLCCLTETLYLYVQSYSLFVCQVAERPLFVERSHTWHNDLIPWGADNISLISHYFVRDNNNEARSGDKARGEMQQWTSNTSPELPWSKSAVKWKSQLVMMGFKFNKQIDGRSSDWVGTSFLNRHSFIAKSSFCSTFWLQNWSPAAICRASNLSAKGLNASHASHAQVKSQQQFECSKRAEDCCSLKLKIENCQVRLFQLVPCRESLIAASSGSIPHIALWTKITLETEASLSREALQGTLASLWSSVRWTERNDKYLSKSSTCSCSKD